MTKDENNHRLKHRERVRASILENGVSTMAPYQVLEYILFHAIPYKDTKEIAHTLIKKYGGFSEVLDAEINGLMKVKNMTFNAALLLHCLPDISRLYYTDKNQPKAIFDSAKAVPYLRSILRGEAEEILVMLSLDANFKLLHTDKFEYGSSGSANIDMKKLVDCSLNNEAKKIILAHNHPSNCPKPSQNDVNSTAILRTVFASLSIEFIDHFIIADDCAYSLSCKTRIAYGEE